MRIVITGGAGFLGSHLTDRCLAEGHEVVAVDNLVTGNTDNLAHIDSPQLSYLQQNISDGIHVDGAVDFILHFASPASPVDYLELPIQTLKVGALGTHNALGLARAKGAGLLLASTSEVYGDPLVHPQKEDYWGNVNSIGPRSCYDRETELLTEDGWVKFPDLQPGVKVATMNPLGLVEYHVPDETIVQPYQGELLQFANSKMDLCVTPDHKMYVRGKTGKLQFKRAGEINYARSWRALTGAGWSGKEREFHQLGARPRNAKSYVPRVKMDTWLEFLGYYISEGCTHIRRRDATVAGRDYVHYNYNVLIAQEKPYGRFKINACLQELGFNFHDSDHHQFRICSQQLVEILAPLGQSGDKYIPREFLNLSVRQSRILFDALMLGDGSSKGEGFIYYSKSRQLADDVQELALRCGFAATCRRQTGRDIFCVNIRPPREAKLAFPQKVPYNDLVYCVNVKHHVICVRRSGRAVWCGNCYDEAKRFAEAMTMAYHRQHQIDTKIVRIFNTYGPRMRLRDGRIVPNFMRQALTGEPLTVYGDGSQTRSFCYATDLIDGIYRLMLSDEHLPTNIGNPTEFTVLEFAHQVLKLSGSKSEIVFEPLPQDDPKQRKPDIAKAREILGWEPKIGLEEGLAKTLDYFKMRLGS